MTANFGDEIMVEDRGLFEVVMEDGNIGLKRAGLCQACHKNPGDDFLTPFGNLCARCINTAMEIYVAHVAIEHLLNNDEQIVEVLHIMERNDLANRQVDVPYVDFHSSAIDYAWGMSEDDMSAFGMSLSASIRSVIESRTLLQRT